MNTENKTVILAITENGRNLAIKVSDLLGGCDIYFKKSKSSISKEFFTENVKDLKCEKDSNSKNNFFIIEKSFKEFVGDVFAKYENIVFIMATGIVVRSIAPYIESKFYDPAVLVMDEHGKNVISLLSGHIGGANELTHKICELIEANPVITTATDVNRKSSLDMIAKKLNAHVDNFRDNVKDVNSLLVNNKTVGIYVDGEYNIDLRGFEILNTSKQNDENNTEFKLVPRGVLKNELSLKPDIIRKIVVVTDKKTIDIEKDIREETKIKIKNKNNDESNLSEADFIKVVPRDIVVGIGCRRDTSSKFMYESFVKFLDLNNIDINSIAKVGSIELKKDEKAINDLAKHLEVPFDTFSAEDISKVDELYERSEFVKKNVGVHSVSEPVAHIMSNGNLIINKHKYSGITFALGRIKL
ncbi:cobalt-precorrin 5A hydrolase [Metaclostridioides mangenotii]|uniref:Cobalt-precorrin 5A hydrolase n=1 Tax=Metaclostridioides mangenotii TaxID=1540 RepID=A0ABS4EED4_9FIRM|nr:cobalt-precorrin 5A hydrolase [Clostridioides mangenotii]MBP1856287.1 cobalt-precorrin 5A hydrolase [Clostridioides mangenotii]